MACPGAQRCRALRSTSFAINSQLRRLPGAGGQVRTWCAVFAAGGAVAFLSCLLQQSGFAAAGMELTRRLRLLLLSTLLRQARPEHADRRPPLPASSMAGAERAAAPAANDHTLLRPPLCAHRTAPAAQQPPAACTLARGCRSKQAAYALIRGGTQAWPSCFRVHG